MPSVNRRKLLIGTAAGLTTSYAAATTTTEYRDSAPALRSRVQARDENDEPEPQPRPNPDPSRSAPPDAVAFWSETILDLVALDHSIDAKDARAPGPCASARAVALAHIVMADAVCAAYRVDYDGLYVRQRNVGVSDLRHGYWSTSSARRRIRNSLPRSGCAFLKTASEARYVCGRRVWPLAATRHLPRNGTAVKSRKPS